MLIDLGLSARTSEISGMAADAARPFLQAAFPQYVYMTNDLQKFDIEYDEYAIEGTNDAHLKKLYREIKF